MTIYEVTDTTDEERYYPIGLFLSLADAIWAIDAEYAPWELCELAGEYVDEATIEIRERETGIHTRDTGKLLWSRSWYKRYDDATDDYLWTVKSNGGAKCPH